MVTDIAQMNRAQEPSKAPHSTEIGQLHKYTPYERLPRATSGRDPKNDRAAVAAGWTTTATATSDSSDTAASCQR